MTEKKSTLDKQALKAAGRELATIYKKKLDEQDMAANQSVLAQVVTEDLRAASARRLGDRFPGLAQQNEIAMRSKRKRLLQLLANCKLNSGTPQIMQATLDSFAFALDSRDQLLNAQQVLRILWPREVRLHQKQVFVDRLLIDAVRKWPDEEAGLFASLFFGSLQFPLRNFPGQLVIAILENWTRMAKCENPECVTPYFFAKKSTQKICERGECTRYAVRKKALKWWHGNKNSSARKKGSK